MRLYTTLILILLPIPFATNGQEASTYDEAWNCPTISHTTTNYKYQYFGSLAAPFDRHPTVDISSLPPISGLKYRSCYFVCPTDSCNAGRALFALRCPDKPALLRWVSSRAEWFTEWCETDDFELEYVQSGKKFYTCRGLLDHYERKIEGIFRNQECEHSDPDANRQLAMLITDCWSIGTEYTTFYEASWYDHVSAGNTVRESYYTVNNHTGRALEIMDFVSEEKMSELAKVMLKHLKDSFGVLWKANNKVDDPLNVLLSMNGCALLREGMVVYFHPYNIASGIEGQITSIIPYDELINLLNF